MRKSTKITAVVGGVALTVASAGAAYAYWTTSGSGTGTAAAGTNANVANGGLTVVGSVDGGALVLVPASPADGYHNVTALVTNTAAYSQNVGRVTVAFAAVNPVTLASGVTGTCDTSNFDLAPVPANSPLNLVGTLAPGANNGGQLVGQVRLVDKPGTNQDACKGATLNLAFTAAQGS